MELDWCSDENLSSFENFNENSIISKNKKKNDFIETTDCNTNDNLNLDNCFKLDLNCYNNQNVLLITNYLSFISNHLRTLIRNKSTKFGEIKKLTLDEHNLIIKYLDWLILASSSIKKFFATPVRRDNSFDPLNIKLFKTSSYKFCNFKESCSIHKNKQSKCDKNHFVFEMIINDIQKLNESIAIIGLDNINWTLSNKFIITTYDINIDGYEEKKTFTSNLTKNEINEKLQDYKLVDDISKVPLGTHLRYFIIKDGNKLFRMGGNLKRNLDLPKFVVLVNALGTEWTVQIKDTTFYKKMSINEIKEEYDDIIKELHEKIKKYKSKIDEKDKVIFELQETIKKIKSKFK